MKRWVEFALKHFTEEKEKRKKEKSSQSSKRLMGRVCFIYLYMKDFIINIFTRYGWSRWLPGISVSSVEPCTWKTSTTLTKCLLSRMRKATSPCWLSSLAAEHYGRQESTIHRCDKELQVHSSATSFLVRPLPPARPLTWLSGQLLQNQHHPRSYLPQEGSPASACGWGEGSCKLMKITMDRNSRGVMHTWGQWGTQAITNMCWGEVATVATWYCGSTHALACKGIHLTPVLSAQALYTLAPLFASKGLSFQDEVTAPVSSNTRLQDPARAPWRGHRPLPTPIILPCQALCLFPPPSGCTFLNNSRTTTHKGFPFAGQTIPSSRHSLCLGSNADWAEPTISNKAAAVGNGLTSTPSPLGAQQDREAEVRRGGWYWQPESQCGADERKCEQTHESSQAHPLSIVARLQVLSLKPSTEPGT